MDTVDGTTGWQHGTSKQTTPHDIPNGERWYDLILRNIIQENPDMYLDEIVEQMEIRCGKNVSISTMWRSLAYCGITRKKYLLYV
ncbi:transposase orfb [Gigaspora margarita]|uniref:Transposase orfb n=1 Tax=Gigaspora margarita TaxID=4874 RepID=A0A8H4AZC8_GIGMA|nr:transposase orfb [Gigaspora margarita]